MKALVLGATGFIGGNVARAALAAGWEVVALRRAASSTLAIADLELATALGDLDDRESLRRAMAGCDLVFHCAGLYPAYTRFGGDVAAQGLRQVQNVLDAARAAQVGRLVYTSSLTTVGPPAPGRSQATEDDWYRPGSIKGPYFAVKWAMEQAVLRAVAAGLPAVVLNPTAVFGPGDVKPTTGALLISAARGQLPVAVDAPVNVVDVRDVAQAHIAAATAGRLGQRYLLAGHNTTLPAALGLLAQIAGQRPPRLVISSTLVLRLGRLASWHPSARQALNLLRWSFPFDNGKAVRELELQPRPLEATFRDALTWFRNHGYL